MNLRFKANNIRLRVTYQELEYLKKFGAVRNTTTLPSGLEMVYEVVAVEDPNIEGRLLKNHPLGFSFCISELELERFINFEETDPLLECSFEEKGKSTEIRFEVDRRSLAEAKRKTA